MVILLSAGSFATLSHTAVKYGWTSSTPFLKCEIFNSVSGLFYYPIAEGDEGEACDEAEEDVGDESADIAVLEHL